MNQDVNEFLKTLRDKTNSELLEIQNTAGSSIDAIKDKTNRKIADLESETDSIEISQEIIESFQRKTSDKQNEWLKRTNIEKGRLIDQLIQKLEKRFKSIPINVEFYDLLNKLFLEVEKEAGSNYEVHITKNTGPEKFKAASSISQNVIADLDGVGVLVKRLDFPISIENTLESRFAKSRDELIIVASHGLWNDLEDSPWQFQQVMSSLLSKK
jgi:vacuolar-type H+-ATPase subunit E/Vma4